MPILTVHDSQGEHRLPFEGSPRLSSLLVSLPDAPSLSCGGRGICGRCVVYASGGLSPAPDASGSVRSCQTNLTGDAHVWLPRRAAITQIEVRVPPEDYPLLPVPGEYAAAVDLGTTTIVLRLLRLADGAVLATAACENPQRTVAPDVIGRMDAALHGQLPLLTSMVREAIDALERTAAAQANLAPSLIGRRVIAGNTAMLYLYTGRSPETLSRAPFQPDCLFDLTEGRDILPACAGAFIGADITCALLSSGLCRHSRTALLVDLGTNGEIALTHRGQLFCCATAAGPAFEGGGISCGCGSVPGAIVSADAAQGQLMTHTIGGAPAIGLCGSGLIDVAAALLDLQLMDEDGLLRQEIALGEGIALTQRDVRQLQLAKGAVAAGIRILLDTAGVDANEVDALYLAGGFGSQVNLRSAVRIGLIPAALADRTVVLGNASLGGAQRLLLHSPSRAEATRLAREAQCLNLAESPDFLDAFVDCMAFA